MNLKTLSKRIAILTSLFVLVIGVGAVGPVRAETDPRADGTIDNGWKVPSGGSVQITRKKSDATTQCQKITNSTGQSIFIPTKTSGEWDSFEAAVNTVNHPYKGRVTIEPCSVSPCTITGVTPWDLSKPGYSSTLEGCAYNPNMAQTITFTCDKLVDQAKGIEYRGWIGKPSGDFDSGGRSLLDGRDSGYTLSCSGFDCTFSYNTMTQKLQTLTSDPAEPLHSQADCDNLYQKIGYSIQTLYDVNDLAIAGTNADAFWFKSWASGVSCPLPWGGTIAGGQSVTAYQNNSVGCGSRCVSETRTCNGATGQLDGTYMNKNCTVQACSCPLPWGGSIAGGLSVTAYQNNSVACGSSCVSETRICNGATGQLDGTYMNQNCTVQACPSACPAGYTWVAGLNACYTPLKGPATYAAAIADCRSSGGVLAPGRNSQYNIQSTSSRYMENDLVGLCTTTGGCNAASIPTGEIMFWDSDDDEWGLGQILIQLKPTIDHRGGYGDYSSNDWAGKISTYYYVTPFSEKYASYCPTSWEPFVDDVCDGTHYYWCAADKISSGGCTLPWGNSIANGETVWAFRNHLLQCGAPTDFWGRCADRELRTCTNGVLSGSDSYTQKDCHVLDINGSVNCVGSAWVLDGGWYSDSLASGQPSPPPGSLNRCYPYDCTNHTVGYVEHYSPGNCPAPPYGPGWIVDCNRNWVQNCTCN